MKCFALLSSGSRHLTASLLGLSLLTAAAQAGIVLTTDFEEGGTTGSGSALANGLTYRVSGGAGTSWQDTGFGLTVQAGTDFLYTTHASVRNFSTLFSSLLVGDETSATLSLNLGFGTGTVFGTDTFNVILFADVNGDHFYTSGGTEDIATVKLGDFAAPKNAGEWSSTTISFTDLDTSSFVGKNLGFFISAKTDNATNESFAIDGPITLTVIPEPSTFAAFLILLVPFVLRRRRGAGVAG